MKKLLLYIAMAMAFMISMPTMAGSVAGYSTNQTNSIDQTLAYNKVAGVRGNASSDSTGMPNCMACSALYVPIIAYERPRIRSAVYKQNNDGLVTVWAANAQAKPYAFVVAV